MEEFKMSKMKKYLLTGISYVLVAALAIGGTIAYLQDTDEDVNVMTLGNVQIEQIEQEWNADQTELVEFTQAKPLYPYVGELGWKNTNNYAYRQFTMNNVVDKYVTVKNTGKSDAYVRTLIAFELGEMTAAKWENTIGVALNSVTSTGADFTGTWAWGPFDAAAPVINVDGHNYLLYVATHQNPVKPGETTIPSLLQVYMYNTATNDDCATLDGNENGTYDIMVLSQAVQAAGFDTAKEALDTAFGAANVANATTWFSGTAIPSVFSWEGVNYVTEDGTATANAAGGDTIYRGILSEGQSTASDIVIGEGIVRLNNRALCKDMNLKTVTLPNSLTYIDEGVFQQSGFVEIEVPENVTYIGKTAFGACPDLEKIVIKAKNVTFADYVGRDSGNLKEVYIYSDTVTFESGSMYFTNAQTGDASKITFYVSNQAVADALFNASAASRSYGMLIKSIDGATEYYNTLK
jgi:predicted ribosomally synthesized peptide with SipW-like signal peptide